MNRRQYMNDLHNHANIDQQIHAVNQLKDSLGNPSVLSAVCLVACETKDNQARGSILAALSAHTSAANLMFVQLARHNDRGAVRMGALMNLCLTGCRSAREVVLQGLRDSDLSVRFAAALHIGLYLDADAQRKFKLFLERHRTHMASANMKRGIIQTWHWTKRCCLQAAKNRNAMFQNKPPKLQTLAPSFAG